MCTLHFNMNIKVNNFCAVSRLLPKKIFGEPFGLPTLKVSSPSHFFKSPELINSSWDHILQESEDESSKVSVRATCSEIWSPTLANKAPQATGRPLSSNHECKKADSIQNVNWTACFKDLHMCSCEVPRPLLCSSVNHSVLDHLS